MTAPPPLPLASLALSREPSLSTTAAAAPVSVQPSSSPVSAPLQQRPQQQRLRSLPPSALPSARGLPPPTVPFLLRSCAPLIPPFRFAYVEDGICRGAYPTARNLRFLARLKLRTVISLMPTLPNDEFAAFCANQSAQACSLRHPTRITIIVGAVMFALACCSPTRAAVLEWRMDILRVTHVKPAADIRVALIPVERFKETITLTHAKITRAIALLLSSDAPVYVHCFDGAHNTGLVIMVCSRRLPRPKRPRRRRRRITATGVATALYGCRAADVALAAGMIIECGSLVRANSLGCCMASVPAQVATLEPCGRGR